VPAPPTHWGWHQLRSSWAHHFVEDAVVRRGDVVLDIGAGTGAITEQLLTRGARVIAFELHPSRAAELRRRFSDDVMVVQADVSNLRLPRRPFRVVANLPFGVSVAVLRRLTSPGSRLVRADLIVPRHTAERWVYGTPPGARRWRNEFSCSMGRRLPRSAFSPPPPNDVAILIIRSVRRARR
jgi:23S rRNA (adenine-N6)-dimethyltransferase